MIDVEQKLEQYETTVVEVANSMYNDEVRAKNSKEIIENFPNVRLASEKTSARKVLGGWEKILPPLLLTVAVGTSFFFLGYNIRQSRENSQRMYTIDELINRDLASNKGFTFTGDIDFFTETYALRILNLRASDYVLSSVKEHFKKYIDPKQSNTIIYNKNGDEK